VNSVAAALAAKYEQTGDPAQAAASARVVIIGSDRWCLARHGEIIRHNINDPPTPGRHLMRTDSVG
jgi:hypothetical protein